ncbi:MAG: tagaturonate epimerase family protein [Verrucomicrobiota bacterium]
MNQNALKLSKFSLGVGDRFAHQAEAQLRAWPVAADHEVEVVPVWNKSNREHLIVGSEPAGVRAAADAAVKALGWRSYHVDADHIGLKTVDRFLVHSDHYTIDVADFIGKPADAVAIEAFVDRHPRNSSAGSRSPGLITRSKLRAPKSNASRTGFCSPCRKPARSIATSRRRSAALVSFPRFRWTKPIRPEPTGVARHSRRHLRTRRSHRTIAPKFTGRFNKGVDYVGDVVQFEREFSDDICVVPLQIKKYGLPDNLKLSVHSGSDKFSIYPAIDAPCRRAGAGVHLKTAAGTAAELEEIIGLAEAGGEGLVLAKEIYAEALAHCGELCAPCHGD